MAICSAHSHAQRLSGRELVALAQANSPELAAAVSRTFPETDLKRGVAKGYLSGMFFAVPAASQPVLMIDDSPGPEMRSLAGTGLWYAVGNIPGQGHIHEYFYTINGKRFGGSNDLVVAGAGVLPETRACRAEHCRSR